MKSSIISFIIFTYNLRISVKKLLKHTWIADTRKCVTDSIPQQEVFKNGMEALKYGRSKSIKTAASLPLILNMINNPSALQK